MGALISYIAFPRIPCSYNYKLSYLHFVDRTEIYQSCMYDSETIHKIPIRYYELDVDLPTILMCHGNGVDIGCIDISIIAKNFNVNVCIFDYAGYGLHSCRSASELGCQEDVIAVYKYLIDIRGVIPENLIIYGRSLGSGVACYLAHYMCTIENNKPRGLVLVSPLMSAVRTVMNSWLPGDIFMNYMLAPKITCPTLILHGDNDDIIPYSCGYELSKLFPNLSKFVTLSGCGHNDISCLSYYTGVINFLETIQINPNNIEF